MLAPKCYGTFEEPSIIQILAMQLPGWNLELQNTGLTAPLWSLNVAPSHLFTPQELPGHGVEGILGALFFV